MVETGELEDDDDERHQTLDDAELKSALLAEPQESNVVRLSSAQGSCNVIGQFSSYSLLIGQHCTLVSCDWSVLTCGPVSLDRLAPDLRHDVALAPQVLIAETQEVVDHERLVTVPDRVEVDVEIVVTEEEETDPGLESVDGDDEEDPDNPSLFSRVGVVPEILIIIN